MDIKLNITPVLAGVLALFLTGCGEPHKSNDKVVRNVLLTEVEPIGDSTSSIFSGVVEEGKNINAAFMTGGKILSMNVKEGDRIRKGQLLATLDATDYEIGVNQLRVQFRQMENEKKRMDEMFARHNIAPNDYEKFEAGFKQLKLQLEMAENKLGYTKLYSPCNGFISFKFEEPGELVDAGTPIYKITDDSILEVVVDLPLGLYLQRSEIKSVSGKTANITEEIPLKIDSFTPDADNNQLYRMKLAVPQKYNKELTTGMNISVSITMNNEIKGEALIPSRALFEEKDKSYVWVFNSQDSTIRKREVNIVGQPKGSQSCVSGLSGDMMIVAAGVKQLKEGEKVNVVSNPLN